MRRVVLGVGVACGLGLSAPAVAMDCDSLLEMVGRIPLDELIAAVARDPAPIDARLLKCLVAGEAPAPLVAAVQGRVTPEAKRARLDQIFLDPKAEDLPARLGDAIARLVALADPGPAPIVVEHALPADDLPDWLWARADAASLAVLEALPEGSEAAESPSVLGSDAAQLADPARKVSARRRLERMGFRRTLRIDASAEGATARLRVVVTRLDDGRELTAVLRAAPVGSELPEPPPEATGWLTIRSTPEPATVRIGSMAYETPATDLELPAGEHVVVLDPGDGPTAYALAVVRPGVHQRVHVAAEASSVIRRRKRASALQMSGGIVAGVGLAAGTGAWAAAIAGAAGSASDEQVFRVMNTAGWVVAGVGAGVFTVGTVQRVSVRRELRVSVQPSGLSVGGTW